MMRKVVLSLSGLRLIISQPVPVEGGRDPQVIVTSCTQAHKTNSVNPTPSINYGSPTMLWISLVGV